MHIAIISYTFPPSLEIGGRRWAKFCKQLQKKGNEVTVICSGNTHSSQKDWYRREFPEVNIKVLPKRYPPWLSGNGGTFMQKVLYWFVTRFLKPLLKINVFDKGFLWRRPLLRTLRSLHQEKPIDVLVATGAPFSILSYGAEFKERFNEIFYVIDFRDPWTWGNSYGINSMSDKQLKYQNVQETRAVAASNMICYPAESMGHFLKQKYPDSIFKLHLLTHAFEPERFDVHQLNKKERKGYIYGGSLYNGIEESIEQLRKVLEQNPSFDFSWSIYTQTHFPLLEDSFAAGKIKLHPYISEEELFKRISQSKAYLVFFPMDKKDFISTKFYEIIYTQTPIIYIGETGALSDFIQENKVGVHILPEDMENKLPQYLAEEVPHEPGFFDIQKYTFSSVTDNFINKVKTMMNA